MLQETTNIVEALAMWQGLFQACAHGIDDIIVFGDSRLIIHALVTKSLHMQMKIRQIIKKIQRLTKAFRKIDFYHAFRNLNDRRDAEEKDATPLSKGILRLNGRFSTFKIP